MIEKEIIGRQKMIEKQRKRDGDKRRKESMIEKKTEVREDEVEKAERERND